MKNVICEIKKSLFIPFFVLSCIGVTLVCLLSVGYISISGKEYTIIELFLFLKRDAMLTDIYLNRYEIWSRGVGTWTQLLLPLLLGIGYLSIIANEKRTGIDRLLLLRSGNLKYSLSKAVSAMISGGSIMLTGYILFGLIVFLKFPSIHEYPTESICVFMELHPGFNEIMLCIKKCIGIFIYGMSINAVSFFISIFFTDKYILFCLPVMLKYIWGQVILKVQIDATDMEILNISSSLSFENILMVNNDIYWVMSLVFILVIYIAGICIHIHILKKKGDGYGFE